MLVAAPPEPTTMSTSPAMSIEPRHGFDKSSEADHAAAHLLLSVSPQNGPFRGRLSSGDFAPLGRGRSDSDLGLLWCVRPPPPANSRALDVVN